MKYLFILVTVSICLSFAKGYDGLDSVNVTNSDSLTFIPELKKTDYSITDSIIKRYPFGKQNNINRFFPGVVSYFQNFYIRGGENYETGFFIDGVKFNDLFTGINAFFINPNVFNKIDYYNGFIPVDFMNTSAGLFNYDLKIGGDKLSFDVEYQSDNITFTNDAYSGEERLGAFYYGYNETNVSLEGPLYFPNVRFFANANYLFQRDKNPQRYPGADNLLFYDFATLDSITINLPAGIVPNNSFESTNFLSTLLFDFDEIKIKASGIYFDETSLTERQHLLEYLNPRLGLIDKSGGIFYVNFEHKLNDLISYSFNGNYYSKNEMTSDQYLGEDYWSYGDSVANAEAGVVWQRDDFQYGRYKLPSKKQIMSWSFPSSGFPGIDHQKSEQQQLDLSGFFKVKIKNHEIRMGGNFVQQKLRFWEIFAQRNLAAAYASYREDPQFQSYTEEELKELIAIYWGVNNFGYDPLGTEANSGLYEAPSPVQYSVYLDDQFNLFKKLVLYLGLKYDHFDFDYMKMIDPAAPEKTFDRTTLEVNESGLTQANPYSLLSPKLSIEYFLQNNFSMIANYVQNVQSHPANFIYCGIHRLASYLTPGLLSAYFPIPTGDIDPLVTNLIELKLTYSPPERFKTILTGYYKKTSNYLSLEYQYVNPNSPFTSYYYLGNNNEMDIWGMEFLFDYYLKGFNLKSIINFQSAEQLVNFPTSNAFQVERIFSSEIQPERINVVGINALLDYNFYSLQNTSSVFNKLNLSVLLNYNSGHPYYLVVPDSRPSIGPFSGTTPNVFQVDMKLEKGFSIINGLNLNLYLYVINLFDTKNVYDVFESTGSAEDDGRDLTDFVLIYGEQYETLYQLLNQYNPKDEQQTFYGPPRQIGLGIKLNY